MPNQNLLTNFQTVKALYISIQTDLYKLRAEIAHARALNYSIPDPLDTFTKPNATRVSSLHHRVQKGLALLAVNKLLLDGAIDDVNFDKLEYLMRYDKYQERFEDLKLSLIEAQLTLDQVDAEVIKVGRKALLQSYSPVPQDDDAANIGNGSTLEDHTAAAAQNRDDLFAARSKDIQNLSTNEKVLKTNRSITSILFNTYGIMESNVINSDLLIETFSESTNSLVKLADRYDFLSSTLVGSKNLITELQKADSADLRKMKLALAWFGLCCFWILWRRVLKYPAYLILWILWAAVKTAFYLVGLVKTKPSVVDISLGAGSSSAVPAFFNNIVAGAGTLSGLELMAKSSSELTGEKGTIQQSLESDPRDGYQITEQILETMAYDQIHADS